MVPDSQKTADLVDPRREATQSNSDEDEEMHVQDVVEGQRDDSSEDSDSQEDLMIGVGRIIGSHSGTPPGGIHGSTLVTQKAQPSQVLRSILPIWTPTRQPPQGPLSRRPGVILLWDPGGTPPQLSCKHIDWH